ncbi:MAG: hypothetical protein JSR96_11820 [Proteobacteria bacterium]|nr:hypothetical protein [Pseudomonadota bacterium]
MRQAVPLRFGPGYLRLLLVAVAVLLWPNPAGAKVSYRISPTMRAGNLVSVGVEIRLKADAAGHVTLDLPDSYGGEKEHWRHLRNFAVVGARADAPDVHTRVLTARPGALITIRYDVVSAYAEDPNATDGNPYKGPIVRPTWFAALGETWLATPRGRDDEEVSFRWSGWPKDWHRVSSADPPHGTVAELAENTLLAGPGVRIVDRPITGGTLRVAFRGKLPVADASFADSVQNIVSAQRRWWGDQAGPYTVTLFELAPKPGSTSSGGTGRRRGFAMYATSDVDAGNLVRTIAHEHLHNWSPRRMGAMADGDEERLDYWASEGFTDFLTARTMAWAGLWTPQQFQGNLNTVLARLASSPARLAPNSRIRTDFWKDDAVGQLPYDRGMVFALLLDHRLRALGKGGLDPALKRMRDHWVHSPAGAKPMLRDNLIAALDQAGLDARPLIARYIEAGEPITLAPDLFGACAVVDNVMRPAFDPGFDRAQSRAKGIITGVDKRGKAYAAGLRDGMVRTGFVSGEEGNSSITLAYRVKDLDGRERVIEWKPEGASSIPMQQVRLTGDANACRQRFGGN